MSNLFKESGGSNEDRVREMKKLCERIVPIFDNLNEREQSFVESFTTRNTYVSAKQIFWLRDICTKYEV